ncbi:PKD domain-containing protein [Marinomonas agarivorans]|nr:PKD domain-containing protein [Marinomonas agarivorans]
MKTNLLKILTFSSLCAAQQVYAAATCTYQVDSEWPTGFTANITITNTGNTAINGWDVSWQYNDGSTVSSAWNATFSGTNPYSASSLNWNGNIAPQASVSFGLQGAKANAGVPAAVVAVTGDVCSGDVGNTAPVADFSVITNNLLVDFDASSSYDADNDPLSFSWKFGDGVTATGATPTHTYSMAGNYTVELTVSDGKTTTKTSKAVNVTAATVNLPPVAKATHITNGLTVSVDASMSVDPNGDSLTYTWDFGDGNTASGQFASHTYSTDGSYTVELVANDGALSGNTSFVVSVSQSNQGEGHVSNPFLGATSYINSDYANLIDTSIAQVSNADLIRKMNAVKQIPTAVWLDRIDAIYGGSINGGRLSLEQHLEQALLQKQGNTPITVSIVVYNLPDRDCAALASNGTLNADENGLQIYKDDYIDAIVNIINQPRFNGLRIIATIEPDSLPNLVTNRSVPACAKVAQDGTYVDGISYALSQFAQLDNVYTYLDIAHSGWLGWENNMAGVIPLYTDLVRNIDNGNMSVVDGFVTNVSNTTPVEEPFLPDPKFDFDNDFIGIESSNYYEWNPVFDEKDFAEAIHARFVASGFPQDVAIIIDTSRNGWGGPNRPTSANNNAATEDQYVMDSKIDRRAHRGLWCNVSGAGIGERPQALPFGASHVIEAYVWIKPPGESDGTSDSTQTTPDDEGKSFDPMCDPTFITPAGVLTGAMDNAPSSGSWFHQQFKDLVENAHPAL